jgi:DNA-binding NarL/FixJ family response regulator
MARATLASLSERQLQVAHLVAQGLTNREIAQTLVVSEKTVEAHLSAVFVKLGVSSRAKVTQALADEE